MYTIGFIGLGIMGESMAENLVSKSSKEVYVYDIVEEKIKKLVKLGAKAASSLEEIADKCNVIISMVPKDEHVISVYNKLIPNLKKDTILIDMSTINPKTSIDLADKAKKKGCNMLDAPVVKSKPAAIEGTLGIYVGGDKNTYEKVKEILYCMGSQIIYMGKNGAGLVMKICHNMLVAQIQNGVNEMLILAEKSGLDFDDVITAIGYGGGQNFYLDSKKDAIKNEDFTTAFSVANMYKDIHIATNLAKEIGVKLSGASIAQDIYDYAMEKGLGNKDFSSVIKVVKELTEMK